MKTQEENRLAAGLSRRNKIRKSEAENKTFNKRIIVSVSQEMHEDLRSYCLNHNINMSAFIRELIRNGLPE